MRDTIETLRAEIERCERVRANVRGFNAVARRTALDMRIAELRAELDQASTPGR